MADLDVVGIGNALVDVLSQEADAFLAAQGLIQGAMQLVDDPRAQRRLIVVGHATPDGQAPDRAVRHAAVPGALAHASRMSRI